MIISIYIYYYKLADNLPAPIIHAIPSLNLMTAITRTAYPYFKDAYNDQELQQLFLPTEDELNLIYQSTNSLSQQLTLLVFLKSCQTLGYIPPTDTIPEQIILFAQQSLAVDQTVRPFM